jgi:hypothetical protein
LKVIKLQPGDKKKIHSKLTIKLSLFTSTFLYNTYTYIYNCTYKVCVNKIDFKD